MMKVRLTGGRTPFKVGDRYTIPISEADTMVVECYEVIYKTGCGLCMSVDGQKFRAYANGWSDEDLAKLGPTTVPLHYDHDRIFYKDDGREVKFQQETKL